jgi:hypothetical protein
MMPRILFLSVCIFALGLSAGAQATSKVEFPSGQTSVSIKDTLDGGFRDYIVRAHAGERILITLNASDSDGRFNIYRKNYDEPLGEAGERLADGITGWNTVFGADGDYHIYIFHPKGTRMTYSLAVTLRPKGTQLEDYDGYYAYPKTLKGFPGFDGVVVNTVTYAANGELKPVKPRAGVVINDKTVYGSTTTLKGNDLSFETRPVRGVSYSFTGAFVPSQNIAEPKLTVLKGQLTRNANGKKTEANVTLNYEEGVD